MVRAEKKEKVTTLSGENVSEYQIQYDLCEIIQDWVNAENEEQCKLIYSRILSNDIFYPVALYS